MTTRRHHTMDYISDKTVYRAVMFARKMIGNGTTPGMANTIAAKYYGVSVCDVARYTGQHAARIRTLRRIRS